MCFKFWELFDLQLSQLFSFCYLFFAWYHEVFFFFFFTVFLNFILFLFIFYFWLLLGVRCCMRAFSGCDEQGLPFVAVCRLLIAVASLVVEHGLQARGLQQLWLMGPRAQAQQLWHTGLAVPRHVGFSGTRARTRVSCIGRWILNHCATREAPTS